MKHDLNIANKYYNRGLVLGLTLAETILLVVFSLLLIIFSIYLKNEKQSRLEKKNIKEKEEIIQELKNELKPIEKITSSKNDFDDIFKKLELAKRNEQEILKLREQIKEYKKKEKNIKELEKKLTLNGKYKKLTFNKLISLIQNSERAERDLKNAKSQILNIERNLKKIGKGTEMPACWADANSGKTEYIFDIAITSSGLIIHDRKLPHREKEESELPIKSITFDKEISIGQFLKETKPIYKWSLIHECRFFIRLYDLTKKDEKNKYKKMIRILESRFYKYEVMNEVFPKN